jgi:hypothetical protein
MSRPALASPTEDERRFAQAYFEAALERGRDWGAARIAYRRAFPTDRYAQAPLDETEAQRRAYSWLQRPAVKKLIGEMRRNYAKRARLPESRVVEELEWLAVANMSNFLKTSRNGNMEIDLRGLSREEMAAVSEITTIETKDSTGRMIVKTRIKLFDKLGAADRLLRIFGSFNAADDFPVTAAEIQRVIDAMKRRMNLPVIDEVTVTDVNRAPSDDPGSV